MPKNKPSLAEQLKAAKSKPKTVAPIDSETASYVQLDSIRDRPGGDTRELNQQHVADLAESIKAVGLIEPLVLDKDNALLAGGHRRAAIGLLQKTDRTSFDKHFSKGVPVHVMDFSATDEPDQALAVEVAENEQRRDYTPSEVRKLADRLLSTGRFHGSKGRPPEGQVALMDGLLPIVGKSRATIKRYLSESEDSSENSSNEPFKPDIHLDRAIASIRKWEKTTGNDASKLIRAIEKQKR